MTSGLYDHRPILGAIIATAIHKERRADRRTALFVGELHGQVFWLPTMATLDAWCLAAGFSRCEWGQTFRLVSRDGAFRDLHGVVRAWA